MSPFQNIKHYLTLRDLKVRYFLPPSKPNMF